jgi:hypothetical protein
LFLIVNRVVPIVFRSLFLLQRTIRPHLYSLGNFRNLSPVGRVNRRSVAVTAIVFSLFFTMPWCGAKKLIYSPFAAPTVAI